MITVNNRNICENCFTETNISPCPRCGFDIYTYRQDPIALKLGSVLNQRYLIGGVIGKGGFGITYLAFDLKLDTKLAVKEYYPVGLALRSPGTTKVSVSNEKSEEPFRNGAEKFYNEAKMVARFNGNPNIVSVHDFFYENDTVYFTMGYLEGETLKSYLQHGKVTEGQALKIMQDISNALLVAHSANILHRDISPDNIMICEDGSIKLLDFGAARQVMAERSQSLSVILKQGFAPLEQYQKKGRQGPWTDIYALGATIYNALTGELIDDPMTRFDNDTVLMDNDHGISPEFWNVLKKCLMLRIEERYQDVPKLKKDLNALNIEQEPITDARSESQTLPTGEAAKASGSTGKSGDPYATELLASEVKGIIGGERTVTGGQDFTGGNQIGQIKYENIHQENVYQENIQEKIPEEQRTYPNHGEEYDRKKRNTVNPVLIAVIAAIVLILGIGIGVFISGARKNSDLVAAESAEEKTEAETESSEAEEETEETEEATEEAEASAKVKRAGISLDDQEEDEEEGEEEETEASEETEEEEEEAEESEDGYEEKEEGMIAIAHVDATSELKAQSVDHATYYASNVADGNYATAWVDGVDGSAAGQSLTLHLGERRNVNKLVIYNGYLKSRYRYTINGKVVQALIDLGDGKAKECSLNIMEPGMDDVPFGSGELNPTEIYIDEPVSTDTIRFTILSDIPGVKYYDTCISEIEVYGN